MNIAQEKKLGKIILAQLRSRLQLIDNIELQSYIHKLGQNIAAKINQPDIRFHFLLVNNKTINAFATPGGIVALNSGLILVGDSEDEIAGVVSHEIAHVTRRHISRLYSLSQQSQWQNALVVIASIIATTYSSDAGRLGLASAVTLPLEKHLYHSRIFEREADYFGMYLLNQAGYSPHGMVDFFIKLQQEDSRKNIPEFLRTHPLGIERLNSMQQRAQKYPRTNRKDSKQFKYMQAMMRAITYPSKTYPDEKSHIQLYHKAITLTNKNFPYEAVHTLEQIKKPYSDDLEVQIALARALFIDNQNKQAYQLLEKLKYTYPDNVSISYYLIKLLLHTNRAKEALHSLKDINTLQTYYPELIKLSAQAYAALNKNIEKHEALSGYYLSTGRFELALQHLKLASQYITKGSINDQRITQKRKSIVALQKELKQL